MWSTQIRPTWPKSGWWRVSDEFTSPPYYCSPESPKKSLSPRISLLRFSSLRVHCLIEVTWLPHVQFALMSRDKSASKQKYIKQNYRICATYYFVSVVRFFDIPPDSRNKRRILCLLLGWIISFFWSLMKIGLLTWLDKNGRVQPSKTIRIGRMCRELDCIS